MQALSPTLLAAQRRLGGAPTVRVRIEDHELRWQPLLDDNTSTCQTAGCATPGGVVRVRITAAGALDVQRIAAPASPGAWLAWAALADDAHPASDVALSCLAGDPTHLRLFYVRSGGGAYHLCCRQSSDGGESWSPALDCISGLAAPGVSLASANAQLAYHDPAAGLLTLALADAWEGGTWTAHAWAEAGALAARHGVAAAYEGGRYYLASCDEEAPDVHRLRSGTFDEATGARTGPTPLVPPGLPAAGFVPRYPSLARAGGLWHLAYLETSSPAPAYSEPVVLHSPDWAHWSFACWVPLEGFGAARRCSCTMTAPTTWRSSAPCGAPPPTARWTPRSTAKRAPWPATW